MILKIIFDLPLGAFDYLPPRQGKVQIGQRVWAPLGSVQRCGLIVDLVATSDQPKLKPISALIDEQPILAAEHIDFLNWLAAYYHYPLGETLFSALPARLRQGRPPIQLVPDQVQIIVSDWAESVRRAPKQKAFMSYIQSQGGQVELSQIKTRFKPSSAILNALMQKKLIRLTDEIKTRLNPPLFKLNTEQKKAIETVQSYWGQYRAFLLQGITGSGKTEIYIRLAEQALQQKKAFYFWCLKSL